MGKVPVAKRAPQQEANGVTVRKIPKISDLEAANKREVCPASIITPPDHVLSRLQPPARQVIGFKVETHDWEDENNKKGEYGLLGFYTMTTPEELLDKRLVKIGWAIGEIESATGTLDSTLKITTVKERIVQPDGFQISEKASKYHGIKNDCATSMGIPLAAALKEFLTDVINVCSNHGRAISHHMHHDAMIIMHELERATEGDMVASWKNIVRAGVCTMDPCIGKWVYAITRPIGCDKDSFHATARKYTKVQVRDSSKPTLQLKHIVEWLVQGHDDWKQRARTADADAAKCCLVYYALVQLASRAKGGSGQLC